MLQVNSEFYTGWLDHWGDPHAVVDAQKVSRVLGEMLTMGANVNMYVSPNTHHIIANLAGTVLCFVIVNTCHERTKTNNVLVLFFIFSFCLP